jgi:drug/metabolite transporter (DMT)-like permease
VIAAVGAVVVLHESVNPRLAMASLVVIGGVSLVLSARSRARGRRDVSRAA